MGSMEVGSESDPVVVGDPMLVCPPHWDLTPAGYARLTRVTGSPWRGRPAAAASVLCALLLCALAVYAESVPIELLAGLCVLAAAWATTSVISAHRVLVGMPGSETIDLSHATPAQRAAVRSIVADVPSRRRAAQSLTARAAREQGLTRLWLVATKIEQAQVQGEELDDDELDRLTPPTRPARPGPLSLRGLVPAPTSRRPTPWTGAGGATGTPPTTGSGAVGPDPLAATWAVALARYETVMTEWGAIASDPLSALEHAALLDVSQPRTQRFIEALGRAQDRHAILGTTLPTDPGDVREFEDLSRAVSSAWREARRHAAHIGYAWLPDREREDARRAELLLRVACDEAASLAERATAAEQAAKVLRRIHAVILPEPALEVLAATTRLELARPRPRPPNHPERKAGDL